MDELEKIDDSSYCDPQTGEEYFSAEYPWYPSDQSLKQHIILELEKTIESLVLIRLGAEWEAPRLNVGEYFDRIKVYKPGIIREDGSYTEFCNAIADKVLPSWGMYKREAITFLTDIDKVKATYAQPIIEAVEELIEYRTLQKARSQLEMNDLLKRLHSTFMQKVSSSAKINSQGVIEGLKAESSLCLTDTEREEQLKGEYKSRLETLKEKAKRSELAQAGLNFEFLPWQCFTSEHLNGACIDLVQDYINWRNPENIQFDLTLTNRWLIYRYTKHGYWPDNKAKIETSQLAAEWLVIEWIKGILTPRVDQLPAKGIDQVEAKQKNSTLISALFIVPEVREVLYEAIFPYIEEYQRPDLRTLIFNNKIPSKPIKHHCQQNSFAYIFRQLSDPEFKHNLIKGTQTNIAQWICANFTPATYDTVHDVIRGKKEPAKSSRIKINI